LLQILKILTFSDATSVVTSVFVSKKKKEEKKKIGWGKAVMLSFIKEIPW
jgi:hypothetical protein